ncbi:MAG: aspartyl protease family protein [Candidatus Methanoperedens sp.]|nr:aspartyl protease family protein [Candidatus Methanoperedens sp.]
MSQEILYNYIDSDPVVPIKITASNVSNKYLAFLDTGSDGVAIPRELWEKLRLSQQYPVRIQSVTGLSWSFIDTVKIEIFGDIHEVPAVMSDDPEILIGMEILRKYIVCFDGIKKRVAVRKS